MNDAEESQEMLNANMKAVHVCCVICVLPSCHYSVCIPHCYVWITNPSMELTCWYQNNLFTGQRFHSNSTHDKTEGDQKHQSSSNLINTKQSTLMGKEQLSCSNQPSYIFLHLPLPCPFQPPILPLTIRLNVGKQLNLSII